MNRIFLLVFALAGMLYATEYATYYIRDANGNVIAEYDENGEIKHVNIYGLDLIGRFEPDGEDAITWEQDGSPMSQSFRTLKGALACVTRESDGTHQDVLTVNVSEQSVSLYITKENVKIVAGDNGGTPYEPVLEFKTEGNVPQNEFHLNGQGTVTEDPEDVEIDGVDLVVTNKEMKTNKLVVKGEVVIKNSTLRAETQTDWQVSGLLYRKLVGTSSSEGSGRVCVTLYPGNFDYTKAAIDGCDLIFYSEDHGTALTVVDSEWEVDGVSKFWFDGGESNVWVYY